MTNILRRSQFNENGKQDVRGRKPFTCNVINKIARGGGAPQASKDKRRHWNCFSHEHCTNYPKKLNISEARGQLIRSNSRKLLITHISTTSIHLLSVRDFEPKEPCHFPRSEFTLAQSKDIPDAGRSPNAVRDHAGSAQVDFEVDCPSPADSPWPPGDLLITMVKETVILYKKSFGNEKSETFSSLSLIWKWWKRYWLRDCPWLCQSCKRGYIYVQKFSPGSTQLPTSRHLISPS